MLATLGDIDAFTGGDDWAYEMKWDGYRAIATIRATATTARSASAPATAST